jgi:hypothetical protein
MVGRHLGQIMQSLRHTIRLDGLIAVGVAVLAAIIKLEPAPREPSSRLASRYPSCYQSPATGRLKSAFSPQSR